MSNEADIEQGIQLLRMAAAKFEMSPEIFFEAVITMRPDSLAARAARMALDDLDIAAADQQARKP